MPMYELTVTTQTERPAVGPGVAPGTMETVITRTNYARCTTNVEITTNRFDSASKMVFTTVEETGIAINNGAAISFVDNGTPIFAGFIFTAKRSKDGTVEYTAYDQLYYLKAKASYTFTSMSLEQIITQVANDFGLKVGTLAATGYTFPCLVKENTSCLDIIFGALSQTIIQTGKIFCFYDDFGKLTLKEVKDMMLTSLIGNRSMLTDYTYTRDMASDTYNRVKLVRPNKQTGKADAFVHEDTDTQKTWGILQYYHKVDENLNDAQIDEMCQKYLAYYNRLVQSVSIDAIGITGLRAGNIVPVKIVGIEDLTYNRLLLAEKVEHKYEGEAHTMRIDVKNFEQLGGQTWI